MAAAGAAQRCRRIGRQLAAATFSVASTSPAHPDGAGELLTLAARLADRLTHRDAEQQQQQQPPPPPQPHQHQQHQRRRVAHVRRTSGDDLQRLLARHAALVASIADPAGAELRAEFEAERDACESAIERLVDKTLFVDAENDDGGGGSSSSSGCFVEIHAGGGGVDAMDWVAMLAAMYVRWSARGANDGTGSSGNYSESSNAGFGGHSDGSGGRAAARRRAAFVDETPGSVAGLKSCVLRVDGSGTFARLRHEKGVHRLIRLSPFDSEHRRHTSFASVVVVPIVVDASSSRSAARVELAPSDLRWETFRASGAGGQSVNKTESAVRVVHEPTKLVAQCQNERSQLQNRKTALELLTARVRAHAAELEEQQRQAQRGARDTNSFGASSLLRTYTLHPSPRIVCARSARVANNAQLLDDGNLDPWLRALALDAL